MLFLRHPNILIPVKPRPVVNLPQMHAAIISHLRKLFDQHAFISFYKDIQICIICQFITLLAVAGWACQYKIPEIVVFDKGPWNEMINRYVLQIDRFSTLKAF